MTGGDSDTAGIMERGQDEARSAISSALDTLGYEIRGPVDLRPLPFEGSWGVASSVSHRLAGELAQHELKSTGELDGLSKKEARKATSARAQRLSQDLAQSIAARLESEGQFAHVEAVNGYVNISFDPNRVATQLISEVISRDERYGVGPARSERVMVEHSQPNTHKVFHVGHMRNSVLGVAISRILAAAGYPVMQATYPGDIGMHVIRTLWAYERFHQGQEPEDPADRGRWLGQIYSDASARLSFRGDLTSFLDRLPAEDEEFGDALDRMLKLLWRAKADDEDIAYLLGRLTNQLPIDPAEMNDESSLLRFWPIVGDQLEREAEVLIPEIPADSDELPASTPEDRLNEWKELNAHIDWWGQVPQWESEVRETFQRWEAQDPELVELWKTTREWSLEDFRRIFDELGADFDVWFYESEVEAEGKAIVSELVESGLAEISDGLTVVKIDEKLGLENETYRTMPILRSDGTSLYSTKDLALTKHKFEDYGIDHSIWVVDVRQSLYFQQIFKTLELWGFEQSKNAYHLPYEIVTLPDGVISSRKGQAPLYDDVRQAVLQRAREIIDEKNPDLSPSERDKVAWQVGIGSLKYAMLARDNNRVVVFDLDEALSFDGHAAPYIQYAHARACHILEKANWEATEALSNGLDLDFGDIAPEELGLLQLIAQLPAEIQRSADQHRPLLIANYVFELARRFNDFYHTCPVLQAEEPVRTARLALVSATRIALRNGLDLLGVEAPAEM